MMKKTLVGLAIVGILALNGSAEAADSDKVGKKKNAGNMIGAKNDEKGLRDLDAQVAALTTQVQTLKVKLTSFEQKVVNNNAPLAATSQAGLQAQPSPKTELAGDEFYGDY